MIRQVESKLIKKHVCVLRGLVRSGKPWGSASPSLLQFTYWLWARLCLGSIFLNKAEIKWQPVSSALWSCWLMNSGLNFFLKIPEENRLKNSQALLFFLSQDVPLGPIQRTFREIQERKKKKKRKIKEQPVLFSVWIRSLPCSNANCSMLKLEPCSFVSGRWVWRGAGILSFWFLRLQPQGWMLSWVPSSWAVYDGSHQLLSCWWVCLKSAVSVNLHWTWKRSME